MFPPQKKRNGNYMTCWGVLSYGGTHFTMGNIKLLEDSGGASFTFVGPVLTWRVVGALKMFVK